MPTSINQLVNSVGLDPSRLRNSKWGHEIESTSIGIYIVSTSKDPGSISPLFKKAPIDENILKFWINKVRTIQVDGVPATVQNLKKRLESFWLPDENIIYIGQTDSKRGIKGRVNEYYNTELGERKPHAGGHWIKTLKILNQLFVHYIPCHNPEEIEKEILRIFVSQVSEENKANLYDSSLPLPFANLELERGTRKNHSISKSKLIY
ncbi:MAG: hypothetical protein LWX09_12500 [Bacteroidia bacterium]|jgi:hypothetical protein|nr:hypothetical protein [Bacteroidia bacterium]